MTVFSLIASDFKKYRSYGGSYLGIIFFTQGFWALYQYRWAHFFYTSVRIQPFRIIVLGFMLFWQKGIEIITGISIPASVKIGHSFYIAHFGNIIINSNAVIGNNCNISQGVTIGVSGVSEKRGVPILGDDIYIGANAVIAGKIKVGNKVLVAANSLVTTDVPDNAKVIGVPAVVVSQTGSKGYI